MWVRMMNRGEEGERRGRSKGKRWEERGRFDVTLHERGSVEC